ncbi:MAG TPA: substrate-binding domain-containing protein [Parasegetibacter sp.]
MKGMKSISGIFLWSGWMVRFMLLVVLVACGNNKQHQNVAGDDTLTSGTIHISVDESFKPIIDSQIRVFEASYPDAKIIAHYKSEQECFKDLLSDSTRLVIVTRGLTDQESDYFKDTLGFRPKWDRIAYDAIAVIVNNNAKDSLFTMSEIRDLMAGKSEMKYRVVFDGLSATSTVRYALDSVLRGEPLGPNVAAAPTSVDVINYVAGNPDAIGFIGVSWIGNPEDENQLSFLESVRIASVQVESPDDRGFVKPYQANIAKKRYPMVRGLHYIVKENYPGLGRGFTNFLSTERGQLIFRRAYLWPAKMNFTIRNANI